jgi:alpha-L-arabinofuranosidase
MMGEDLEGVPYVDVSVTTSEDRRRLAVFLVNRYLDDTVTVDLAFEGLSAPASGRLRQIAGPGPFARNDFEDPRRLGIAAFDAPSIERLELPPHSVSALLLG